MFLKTIYPKHYEKCYTIAATLGMKTSNQNYFKIKTKYFLKTNIHLPSTYS